MASANIKHPVRRDHGFNNVNKRMEYKYHGYEGEQIWHEFGRPFWRIPNQSKKTSAILPKKEVVIEQTTKERRSSTMRAISKNYNESKKTLTLDVKFELNKADIQNDYTIAIDKLGEALKNDKSLKVEIQGHTDTTGSTAYNMNLSGDRAKSVRTYLMEKFEIEGSRLQSHGYGPKQPVATNETLQGRKLNRRVDIKIIQ